MTMFSNVLETMHQGEKYIQDTGGLPEIARAAQDLRDAIDKTRSEIVDADIASRFINPPGDLFKATMAVNNLSPRSQQLVAEEGEAGLKRSHLESGLESIEHDLFSIIGRLVELRCDLIVSQEEM